MNIKEVKDLIREILQSDICEFELEHTGTKVRLRRGIATEPEVEVSSTQSPPAVPVATHRADPPTSAPRKEILPPPEPGESEEEPLHFITSPIVGTFYRSSAPDGDPFVKIGTVVEEGTVLCIVEAMKLMNEIPSDIAGEVVQIFVDNNHPVEYGQKLFGIRPRR